MSDAIPPYLAISKGAIPAAGAAPATAEVNTSHPGFFGRIISGAEDLGKNLIGRAAGIGKDVIGAGESAVSGIGNILKGIGPVAKSAGSSALGGLEQAGARAGLVGGGMLKGMGLSDLGNKDVGLANQVIYGAPITEQTRPFEVPFRFNSPDLSGLTAQESAASSGNLSSPSTPEAQLLHQMGQEDIGGTPYKVPLPSWSDTVTAASPDYRASLKQQPSALSQLPANSFGGSHGWLGGLADAVQSGLMGFGGHPDLARNVQIAQRRQEAAQNMMNQIEGYKNAANLQQLTQQFQTAYYQNLELPGSQALKLQDLSNQMRTILQQGMTNSKVYPWMLQYMQTMGLGNFAAAMLNPGGQAGGVPTLPQQAGGVPTGPGVPGAHG